MHEIFLTSPSEENDVVLVRKYFSPSSVGSRVFKGENLTTALARAARNIARGVLLEIATSIKQQQVLVTETNLHKTKIEGLK